MPKPRTQSGEKNLISQRLIELRKTHNMSQRDLAYKLQLAGYDMDKNVILLKGSVPGAKGSILKIKSAVKATK